MTPPQGLVLIVIINLLLNSKAVAQSNVVTSNNTIPITNQTIEHITKKAQQAFKEKDYQIALTYYLHALNIDPSFTVKYNLAVCYYTLNQWHKALDLFDQLHIIDPNNDRVHFNLILTLIKLNKNNAALNHLDLLSKMAQSDAIAALAYQKYIDLTKQTTHTKSRSDRDRWLLTTSLSKGLDSNISTIIDETQTQVSDTFTEATASIGWYNSANINNSWLVDLTTYTIRYDDSETYNIQVFDGSLKKHIELSPAIRLHASVRIDRTSIAKAAYMRSYGATIGSRYKANKNDTITIDVRIQKSDALADRYDGLAGISTRVIGQYIKKINQHHFLLKYRLDNDNKNDDGGEETIEGDVTFTSYSATRHSLLGEWRYTLNAFDFSLETRYRTSTYHDEHLFIDDVGGLRKDEKYAFSADVKYKINTNWAINLNGTFTKNNSSLNSYDYTQNLISLGVSWQN